MTTQTFSAKNENDLLHTSARIRFGQLPDGKAIDEIIVFAKYQEITRLAILMDLAGYEMIDRITDKLRPSYQAAIFRK